MGRERDWLGFGAFSFSDSYQLISEYPFLNIFSLKVTQVDLFQTHRYLGTILGRTFDARARRL